MKAFIYQWTNKRNGKKYVGSHIGEIDDGYIGSGKYFKNAYNKEPNNFKREILQIIESNKIKEDIKKLEEKFLSNLNVADSPDYYNISSTYFGGDVYSSLNIEDQISMVAKRSEALRLDRLNNPKKYKEAYIKSSETRKFNSPDIYQFTIDGKLIKKHNCLHDACKEVNASKGNIHSAANGIRNKASGYRWSYSKIPNPIINKKIGRPKGKKSPQKNPSSHVNKRSREILQYDLNNNYIKTWKSAKEIEDCLGISKGIISHVVNGRYGYKNGIYKKNKFIKGNIIKYTEYKEHKT